MPNVGHRAPRRHRWPWLILAVSAAFAAAATYIIHWEPFAPDSSVVDPYAVAEARAFLFDWAGSNFSGAGGHTDNPQQAESVLTKFNQGLDIKEPDLTVGHASVSKDGSITVPFAAKMPISGLGIWDYQSSLPMHQSKNGTWKVHWQLSLVHPHLSDTAKFHLDREPRGVAAIDRHGRPLSSTAHPSLSTMLNQGGRGAIRLIDRVTGTPKGTEVRFGGSPVRTTIDATWQAAAERALTTQAAEKNAALVALRLDNGQVLAAANSPSTGFNRAFSGTYAPGSTWKVVTSGALLLKKAITPADIVDCPEYIIAGKQFHNVEGSRQRNATFLEDFTHSCNTAFISLRDKLRDNEISQIAKKYFGIGQVWQTGIHSYDGSVPANGTEADKAAAMIGQGKVLANPLIMASVTATAASGTFHQPIILSDAGDVTNTTALPHSVVMQLRKMMHATVTSGTATILSDLPGEIGAKTGTAEVSEQQPNNGWLVSYRGNVAIACLVEGGNTGSGSAGPVVRDLLAAIPVDPS
ncbi:penicillin-binding transpeptidase domain-containing protein [Streptomyces sp. NPDC005574]|uniref:penicillin-binding transpeptidase domain-containing protein n=1 Tax=Streptomyces sp. NPDC005574 TaxID=3156891 RepID=UPI0033BA66DF